MLENMWYNRHLPSENIESPASVNTLLVETATEHTTLTMTMDQERRIKIMEPHLSFEQNDVYYESF